jgi:hypothetical protein
VHSGPALALCYLSSEEVPQTEHMKVECAIVYSIARYIVGRNIVMTKSVFTSVLLLVNNAFIEVPRMDKLLVDVLKVYTENFDV